MSVIERVAVFIATAGFAGHFPIAPGTVGSIAGLGVYGLLRLFGAGVTVEATVLVINLALGIWSATLAERLLGGKDPGPVVIDEVVGIQITLAFLNVNLAGAIAGFVLFRVFDVLKPYPAGRLEVLPGGLGVMLDDAMAAIYSHGCMRLLVVFLPGWFV